MLPPSALPARHLRSTLRPLIAHAARASRADRYRKHFPASSHLWMLLMHTMSANSSLRQSYALQSADPRVRRLLGMEQEWISYSQLARSSTSRPSGCFEELLCSVLRLARHDGSGRSSRPEILRGVLLMDSTFFPLCAKMSPWGVWNNRGNSGARLQTLLDPSDRLPTDLRLDLLETNDANALGELDLSDLRGSTLIFDLGYYCHAHFERLLEGGVHFLTRLNAQASYRVICSRELPEGTTTPEGDMLLCDQTIVLGSPNNRRGTLLEQIRLITSKNEKGKVYTFITDRHDLTAKEVLYLYRKRWQIELFFRWLKRQLGALKPFGHSREAVWLTMVVAAIVAVLMALCEQWRPRGMSRVSWMRALCLSFSMLRLSG